MKLTQLRDLIAVAERGGLRRAARYLGLAQPVLTRSIQELERELGTPLLERSRAGVTLTAIGEAFLRRSVSIQKEVERARDEVDQLRGVMSGSVAIGLATAPQISMLPRVLEPFLRKHPDVRLSITEGVFPAMEAELRDGTLDFYIGPLSEDRSGGEMAVEKLFENRRIIFGRPGHPLAGARTLKELSSADWVATSVTADTEAELAPMFARFGLPAPRVVVRARSGLTVISVASSSNLIAVLPQQWLPFAERSGLLQPFQLKDHLEAPTICLVHRSHLPLTPVAEALADLFRRSALNQAC